VSWLRRNLAALIIIVVTIPAFAFVLVWVPLHDRAEHTYVTVKQGDTIEANGFSFTLTASQEFVGTGTGPGTNSIPLGNSLIGALVDVRPVVGPTTENAGCDIQLTSRAGGTDRAWSVVSSPSDFAYQLGDDRTAYCILSEQEPFELEQVFLVPADTYDGATLDIDTGTTTYRFELAEQ
jgi:hypothetical protein